MIDKEQALEIIDKQDFFNDRAGRELWNDKPKEIQDEDIRNAHEDYEALKEYILNQPKVGEWIPLEERLPKQDKLLQDYLVTFEYYRYGEYNRKFKTIGIGTFSKVSHEFTFINGQTGWRDLKVLSWQPLPKLYEVKRK